MLTNKILVIDDEKMVRWAICQTLREWHFVPLEAANIETGLRLFDTEKPILTLLDINLPDGRGLDALQTLKQRCPEANIAMLTANVLVENTIAALRAGACDFLTKPVNLDELRTTLLKFSTPKTPDNSPPPADKARNVFCFESIIGNSPEIKELVRLARKVAESRVSSILLQGESGTGKDLIAKAIHYSSPRAANPFVAVNCAAIPANLIESELFGHEKGSFTDAKTQKQGLFEQARGGTIFLDEIGELDIGLQAKLLRVLEARVLRRVGGLKDLPFEACVIAASNRNLREESEAGRFRHDLYFRLSIIELNIPPLRARGDDVLLLAEHFIKTLDRNRHSSKPRRLAAETVEAFRHYQWGGNIRELRNAIERALILEGSEQITLRYLPPAINVNQANSADYFSKPAGNGHSFELPPLGVSLEDVEDLLIERALQHNGGNVTRAAKSLNISRDQMRYYLKKRNRKNRIDLNE